MRTLFHILSCLAMVPVTLLGFSGSAHAGDIYREGVFLACLERSDTQSLPPLVTQNQHPDHLESGSSAPMARGDDRGQMSTECATHVIPTSAEFFTEPDELLAPQAETNFSGEADFLDCPSNSCQDESGWLCQQCTTLNRKIRLKQFYTHKKTLYPVIRPHCQPGYGVYETCWRQLQPNPCYYRCQDGGSFSQALLPAPQVAPEAPGSQASPKAPGELARPYER